MDTFEKPAGPGPAAPIAPQLTIKAVLDAHHPADDPVRLTAIGQSAGRIRRVAQFHLVGCVLGGLSVPLLLQVMAFRGAMVVGLIGGVVGAHAVMGLLDRAPGRDPVGLLGVEITQERVVFADHLKRRRPRIVAEWPASSITWARADATERSGRTAGRRGSSSATTRDRFVSSTVLGVFGSVGSGDHRALLISIALSVALLGGATMLVRTRPRPGRA